MSDIFISYKREERQQAGRLRNALEQEGWKVWWDPELRAGEHFDDVIERVLKEARCVIVLWSSRSIQSRFVKDEATYALDHGKLVPVRIEAITPPFRFRNLHYRCLEEWDGSATHSEFRALVDDLRARIGAGRAASNLFSAIFGAPPPTRFVVEATKAPVVPDIFAPGGSLAWRQSLSDPTKNRMFKFLGGEYNFLRSQTPPAPAEMETSREQTPVDEVRKRAEAGDADSQFELAERIGWDDFSAKANWYWKAAEQGHVGAHRALERLIADIQGHAGHAGQTNAQFTLGYLYHFGRGVAQDFKKARKWYRKAADGGAAAAAYNLGCMYLNGEGVAPTREEATQWFKRAAQLGDKKAKKILEKLKR